MPPKDEQPTMPEWRMLHYPDHATYSRIVEAHPEIAYNGDTNTFVDYFALPPWVRLGWPSAQAWTKCRGALYEGKPVTSYAFVVFRALYPDRPGIAPEAQDLAMLVKHWPDCIGQQLVDIDLGRMTDLITINDTHYRPGRQRVPQTVANVLLEIAQRSRDERIKALLPKDHADKIIASIGPTGAAL